MTQPRKHRRSRRRKRQGSLAFLYRLLTFVLICGAIVAALIMQEAAQAIGREDLVVFASVILVVQNFIAIPSSRCFRPAASARVETCSC